MDRRYRPGPVANSFRTTAVVTVDGSSRSRTQAQYTARVANTVMSFWGDDASTQTVAVLRVLVEHAHRMATSAQ